MAAKKTPTRAAARPAGKSPGTSSSKRTAKTTAATVSTAAPTRASRQAPEDPLVTKAAEAQRLLESIDRTSFAGDEREVSDELSTIDQHPADHADVTLQRELDYTIREIVDDDLAQIREAMKRKEEGTYGICADCGQKIPKARLEARPEAIRCIDCQRRAEGERV